MSAPDCFVYADLGEVPRLVGRLWIHARGSGQSASFEYDDQWIGSEGAFALEPALQVGKGPLLYAGRAFSL